MRSLEIWGTAAAKKCRDAGSPHVETRFDQCDRRSRCLYLCSTCRCLPRSSPSSWTARMVDSSSTNTDGAATTRAILIGRAGGTTPSSSWQVYRTMLSLSPPRLRTTRSSRSARSSTGPTSRFGATTGRRFKQPPRLPSTARASPWASRATARSARRPGPMSPSGGFSPPLSAQRIARAVCRRKAFFGIP
jgi:hypothetical protein